MLPVLIWCDDRADRFVCVDMRSDCRFSWLKPTSEQFSAVFGCFPGSFPSISHGLTDGGFVVAIRVRSGPGSVLGSFLHSGCGQQLPWLLDRLLRCRAPLRVLEPNGVGPPILGHGACQVLG